jgi:hypothetical protein
MQKSIQQPGQQQWQPWSPFLQTPTTTPTCTQPWDDRLQMCEYAKRNGYCKFSHYQQHGQLGGPHNSLITPAGQPRSPSFAPAIFSQQLGQQQGQLGGPQSSLAIPAGPSRSLNFAPATFLPPLRMPSPSPAPAASMSPERRPATPF